MKQHFHKYHGCGNDFIMIDNREKKFPSDDNEFIASLCSLHFGIGADGLILLEETNNGYQMIYFNADGKEGSMCGNGGRCFVALCKQLQLMNGNISFKAYDGIHQGIIIEKKHPAYNVSLSLLDTNATSDIFINTGSPHHIKTVTNLESFDVFNKGKKIRNSKKYPEGTNVNFVEEIDDIIHVRTYERGVEEETLACGTGVTAVALSFAIKEKKEGNCVYNINAKGGKLKVSFYKDKDKFSNIKLEANAVFVYEGDIEL
jgi:diaminopimelate epimerase